MEILTQDRKRIIINNDILAINIEKKDATSITYNQYLITDDPVDEHYCIIATTKNNDKIFLGQYDQELIAKWVLHKIFGTLGEMTMPTENEAEQQMKEEVTSIFEICAEGIVEAVQKLVNGLCSLFNKPQEKINEKEEKNENGENDKK